MSYNALCDIDRMGCGTFTLAAVEKLCEVLPNSKISPLKCAACHNLDTARYQLA